jgi:hypothetical protein
VAFSELFFIKLILSGARKSFAVTLTTLQGIWKDLQEQERRKTQPPTSGSNNQVRSLKEKDQENTSQS